MVADCTRLFESRAGKAAIELSVDLQGGARTINVDGRRIKQILVNLIGNSMKFTPAGGSIKVESRLNRQGWFVLSVKDSGVGMAAGDIERALQPFSQLESEPGVGTLAQILLPARRVVDPGEGTLTSYDPQ